MTFNVTTASVPGDAKVRFYSSTKNKGNNYPSGTAVTTGLNEISPPDVTTSWTDYTDAGRKVFAVQCICQTT